jgi:molybdopterin-guanine dinucleotide biosynthesis protein A
MHEISVVIQAGGKSSRMGKDKAFLPFHGTSLIQYVLQQVEGIGNEIIIISNQPDDHNEFNLPVFEDIFPGTGPLGGLYTAIYYARYEYCWVFACDMPFINRDLMRHMEGIAPLYDAVVPKLEISEYTEPFRAIYKKSCLPAIHEVLSSNKRRVTDFFYLVNVHFLEWKDIKRYDPQGKSFININTRDDLHEAERIASMKD